MSLLDALLRLPDSKRVSESSSPLSPSPPTLPRSKVADPASEALALLRRFKTLTLPSGRMAAAREIAQRLTSTLRRFESDGEPAEDSNDPAAILDVLRAIEREIVALGGTPDDPGVAAISERVEGIFPGAHLVEVRAIGTPSAVEDEAASTSQPAKVERKIAPAVQAELERIWQEAKRRGWPWQRIFGASFWPVEARGFVTLLDPGDGIVEITSEYIAILKTGRNMSRFRRHVA
jgi:hypothetical protein